VHQRSMIDPHVLPHCPLCVSTNGYEVSGIFGKYAKCYKCSHQELSVLRALLPPEVHLTADFAYFQWHGKGKRPWFDYKYEKEELDPWVSKIEDASIF
jgi:hypothetical protein